jgi:hypothetical protein
MAAFLWRGTLGSRRVGLLLLPSRSQLDAGVGFCFDETVSAGFASALCRGVSVAW